MGALLDIISSLWIFSFPDFSSAYAQAGQRQSSYVPAAELFFTYVFRVETPFAVALQCLDVTLVSITMLRGPFRRWIAYIGLATGALGIVVPLAGQIAAHPEQWCTDLLETGDNWAIGRARRQWRLSRPSQKSW